MPRLNTPPAGTACTHRAAGRRTQSGAATLIVVMVLFFMMMLVMAYASRSLIFEQRTSANQYRSTQAFEAAEAGLQWGLAMLNAGHVDASCLPSASPADNSFRTRYLVADMHRSTFTPVGNPAPDGSTETVRPGCVRNGDGWSCDCPAGGNATIVQADAAGAYPAFTIELAQVLIPGTTDRWPGVVSLIARGCSGVGVQCVQGAPGRSDSFVQVSIKAALVRALSTPPPAALTVGGAVGTAAAIRVVNANAETRGITINAGDAVNAVNAEVVSLPGTPAGASIVDRDGSLVALDPDRFFSLFMGVDAVTYQQLPTVTTIDCANACGDAFSAAYARGARMFFVNGDMTVDAGVAIGTANEPVMVVVNGAADLSGAVQIQGFLYAHTLAWNSTGGGDAFVRGAVVLRDSCCTGTGTPTFEYEPEILARLNRISGTFTRVNGSWKDY